MLKMGCHFGQHMLKFNLAGSTPELWRAQPGPGGGLPSPNIRKLPQNPRGCGLFFEKRAVAALLVFVRKTRSISQRFCARAREKKDLSHELPGCARAAGGVRGGSAPLAAAMYAVVPNRTATRSWNPPRLGRLPRRSGQRLARTVC